LFKNPNLFVTAEQLPTSITSGFQWNNINPVGPPSCRSI